MSITLPNYIEITQNSKQYIASFLEDNSYSQIFVLIDENTKKYCLPLLDKLAVNSILIEVKSGEKNKTLATCSLIWEALTKANADRNSVLLNLGGGVIGDMGGFCASTYKRGIDFINIPTTLLSQVDASIGGKLGIDFNGFKNHIGLFNLPKKVIVDPVFLKTLPKDQLRSGFAEMLKHGFINDANHLNELAAIKIVDCNWLPYIKRSIAIKNEIVISDPLEKSQRKLLNFGHTVGHAVESYFLNNNLCILHGEAVAIGMIAEAHLSTKYLNFEEEEKNKLIKIIDTYFDRIDIPRNGMKEILNNLEQDKKNEGEKIQTVLLSAVSKAQHSINITKNDVEESLLFYASK